jgi:hypothetical protein
MRSSQGDVLELVVGGGAADLACLRLRNDERSPQPAGDQVAGTVSAGAPLAMSFLTSNMSLQRKCRSV